MFFKSMESILLVSIKASEAGLTGAVTQAGQVQLGERNRNIKVSKGGKGEGPDNSTKGLGVTSN